MSDLPAEPPLKNITALPEWDGLWDRSALRRLLGLAGADAANEILHHLRADLNSACEGLSAALTTRDAVSYTHLDVYKRQRAWCGRQRAIWWR